MAAVFAAGVAWPVIAGGGAWWLVGVGVSAGLVAQLGPGALDRLHQRRARRTGLVRRVGPGLATDVVAPSWLLHPTNEVVRFAGRVEQLRTLAEWCADDKATAVRLLVAPGGYGKTRLMRELAARMGRRGWQVWHPVAGHEKETGTAVWDEDRTGRLLVVVDYAESRDPTALAGLLAAVAGADRIRNGQVRLLLAARNAGPWWGGLATYAEGHATAVESLTLPANVVELPARADNQEPDEVVAAAACDFAGRLRRPVPSRLPTGFDPDTPLLKLHAAALLAVLGTSIDARDDVIAMTLRHEALYWRRRAQRTSPPLVTVANPEEAKDVDALLARVAGTAALLGAEDDREVAGIIARTPDAPSCDAATAKRWAAWLTDLYPPTPATRGTLGILQPDLLAEHLAADVLTTCSSRQLATLFTGASEAQATQALEVIGRASAHSPDVTTVIDAVLSSDLVAMTAAVIAMAPVFPGTYASRLVPLLTTGLTDPHLLRDYASRVPYPSLELGRVALALTGLIVDQPSLVNDPADRARWTSWHALRLAETGRRAEALTYSEEAVTHYRQLATTNPDAYLPDLAHGLLGYAWVRKLLAVELADGLRAAEESVGLYAELAATEPAAFTELLSAVLGAQADLLDALDRRDEAEEIRKRLHNDGEE